MTSLRDWMRFAGWSVSPVEGTRNDAVVKARAALDAAILAELMRRGLIERLVSAGVLKERSGIEIASMRAVFEELGIVYDRTVYRAVEVRNRLGHGEYYSASAMEAVMAVRALFHVWAQVVNEDPTALNNFAGWRVDPEALAGAERNLLNTMLFWLFDQYAYVLSGSRYDCLDTGRRQRIVDYCARVELEKVREELGVGLGVTREPVRPDEIEDFEWWWNCLACGGEAGLLWASVVELGMGTAKCTCGREWPVEDVPTPGRRLVDCLTGKRGYEPLMERLWGKRAARQ